MDVLVAYDISTVTTEGERRLARVGSICERFGIRAQYSVFECRISPASFQVLVGELLAVIDRREDSVNIYRFDAQIPKSRYSLGRSRGSGLGEPWVIGDVSRTSSDP